MGPPLTLRMVCVFCCCAVCQTFGVQQVSAGASARAAIVVANDESGVHHEKRIERKKQPKKKKKKKKRRKKKGHPPEGVSDNQKEHEQHDGAGVAAAVAAAGSAADAVGRETPASQASDSEPEFGPGNWRLWGPEHQAAVGERAKMIRKQGEEQRRQDTHNKSRKVERQARGRRKIAKYAAGPSRRASSVEPRPTVCPSIRLNE